MKILGLVRYALATCGVAVVFAGCSGGSSLAPTPATQNAAPASSRAALGRSWMAPDLNLKKKDLLYVSNYYSTDILVFTYPGGKPVGALEGVAGGECTSSASNGNWWVTGPKEILEFAHGGVTPIHTLSGGGGACAIDPMTGNLAAVTSNGVVIYRHAKGRGKMYTTSLVEVDFAGYDSKGDLFVDGRSTSRAFALVELPKGSNSFETITLNQTIEFPGGVQWDGRYLAVGDQETSNVYQFAIDGSNGTLEGTTPLKGASDVVTFWLQGPDVVGVDAGNDDAEIWSYPGGGPPIKIVTGQFDLPLAVVVSVAPK
jgi:hypothetical protein